MRPAPATRSRSRSGTAALHGAAVAAGLGPGDEAITTPMTFAATRELPSCTRAPTSRFADVDAGHAADRARLPSRRRSRPGRAAIIPVDYAGQPADYRALRAIADAGTRRAA